MYFPKCCVKMIFISREWLMFSVLMFIRSSHLYMFFEIVVLKDFANFTEKHLYWSLFLTKLQAWKKRGSKKDRLQHKNLLCNFIVQFIAGACARARVCVCVCVCVCLCLYSATVKPSSVRKISDKYFRGTDQRCYVVSIIQAASAEFLHLHF